MSKQKRRVFDAEFKRDVVAQTEQGDRSVQEIAVSLGINPETVYRWRSQSHAQGAIAFPGNGKEALTDDQKRIKELEKKLRDVEMDREILKKAMAIFSAPQQ